MKRHRVVAVLMLFGSVSEAPVAAGLSREDADATAEVVARSAALIELARAEEAVLPKVVEVPAAKVRPSCAHELDRYARFHDKALAKRELPLEVHVWKSVLHMQTPSPGAGSYRTECVATELATGKDVTFWMPGGRVGDAVLSTCDMPQTCAEGSYYLLTPQRVAGELWVREADEILGVTRAVTAECDANQVADEGDDR